MLNLVQCYAVLCDGSENHFVSPSGPHKCRTGPILSVQVESLMMMLMVIFSFARMESQVNNTSVHCQVRRLTLNGTLKRNTRGVEEKLHCLHVTRERPADGMHTGMIVKKQRIR